MKVLIVGVDSSIGTALQMVLTANGHRVVGTTRRPERVSETIFYLDLDNVDPTEAKIPRVDVAFFCAALTRFADCRKEPEMARRINVVSPVEMAAKLVAQGTRVVLLSTSAVFDCNAPTMRVDRPRMPASIYGLTKAEAEVAFLSFGRLASILRISKVVTPGLERFQDWIRALIQGKTIKCPNDLRISPLALEHVVQALIAIANDAEGGIFQMSAASDISYAETAQYIAGKLSIPIGLVEVRSARELGISPDEITAFTSLDSQRLIAISKMAAPDPWAVVDMAIAPIVTSVRHKTNSI